MGDPTLRLHVVAPPSALSAVTNGSAVTLTWNPSVESVLGYHVYRINADQSVTRVTSSPLTGTTYTDANGTGAANYMVRAMNLESSGSGSYFNLSSAAFLGLASAATGSSGGSTSTGTGSSTGS